MYVYEYHIALDSDVTAVERINFYDSFLVLRIHASSMLGYVICDLCIRFEGILTITYNLKFIFIKQAINQKKTNSKKNSRTFMICV